LFVNILLAVQPGQQYNNLTMASESERLLAYRRTITIIAVIVVLYLSFLIIKPFLVAIIGAAVLAYLSYPFYKALAGKIPSFLRGESVAAVITVLLIILFVLVPTVFITGVLAKELKDGYVFVRQVIDQPGFTLALPSAISRQLGDISTFKEPLLNLASQSIGWLQHAVRGLPGAFLSIFITIFSIYFFLKGGPDIYRFLKELLPLPGERYKEIFRRFDDLARGMIMGQIVVGIVQGGLAWLAYYYLGVSNPVLWAFLTAIISVIPLLGASLVWFPISLYLFATGYYVTGDPWKGIALFIYGFFLISTIDNILKPKIVGDHARVHPLIILFGILGGIQLMGLPGILIGPLVLALFDVVMSIFREVV